MNQKSHALTTTATLAAALALAFAAGTAGAQQPPGIALAQQQNCMSCHAIDRPFMGPAFRDIARRYASRGDAQSYLAHKITEGSSGVWGTVPMPANTQLSTNQATMLAQWILSLRQ